MSPLTLLMCALIGAVLVQVVLRTRVAPHRRWVSPGWPRIAMARRAAIARAVEPTAVIGRWENEGGSIAVARAGDAPAAARPRAGPAPADHGQTIEPKAG
ncbi:MAG: hypothetical protein ABSC46_01815 [Candidatus Limnocylindrales bacterium]